MTSLKKGVFSLRRIIVYIILVSFLGIFILKSDYEFSILLKVELSDIMLLSLIILISYINTYFAVKTQFQILRVKEKPLTVFLISLATNLLNYLPAKGGMLSMGSYLKVKKKIPLNKFVFSTLVIYILVTIITVALSFLFIYDHRMSVFYSRINYKIFLSLTIVLGLVSYLFFSLARRNTHNVLSRYYLLFWDNKRIIFEDPKQFVFMSVIILSGIFLFSARMYISFKISGLTISYYDAFLVGIIANLSFFLSFTPGGLGIKEGFIASAAFLLFGRPEVGMIASITDRAVNLILSVLTGSASIRILDKELFTKKTEKKKDE